MFGVTFLALVASAAALAVDQRCQEVQSVANFQYDEFRKGKWYLYSGTNDSSNTRDCGYVVFKPEEDIIKVTSCFVSKGIQQCSNGTGRFAPDADNHGKLIFTFPNKSNTSYEYTTLNVLATDNKNYVALHHCLYEDQRSFDILWIFTRTKDISDETAASLNKSLDESRVDKTQYRRYNFLLEEACRVA